MEQEKMVKYFGIFITITMVLSLFAYVGYVALSNPTTPSDNENYFEPTATTLSYNLSFDTNAIKDLSSFRIALTTSIEDKSMIDIEVKKIDGVNNVVSQFKKENISSKEWIYFAEVTIKKNAIIKEVVNKIYSLDFFKDSTEKIAMKHMTISVPKSVILHNPDLNIDRNYSFPTSVLSTLTSIETLPGDELVVEGVVSLQGSVINSIELVEVENKSFQERMMQEFGTQIIEMGEDSATDNDADSEEMDSVNGDLVINNEEPTENNESD
ncbi:MAG: hypothetical protein ACOX1V_01320 [Candidatus Iainarchaeum sp.]